MAVTNIFDGPPISYVDPAVASHRPSRPAEAAQRRDIQGLRAAAVVLVILDHVGSWPHGGFIGVDVFFVISGFLITGLLLRAAESATSIGRYFGKFYTRRARRILPASIVVLVACWIAANLTFKGPRAAQTHSDIGWAFGFLANVHFANIGTDYFQANRPPSPVQHYWSLAVEEQFYLVWPVIVFVAFMLLARRRHCRQAQSAQTTLLVVVGVLSVASLAWAVHETNTAPTAAYFSTFVRAWELGVGASLAVAVTRFPRICSKLGRARGPLVLVGLLTIVASAVLTRSTSGFPAPAAVWPVLATALVLFAGTGTAPSRAWAWPISNRVSDYLGDISYSLYLWHWPVIIFVGALVAGHGPEFYALTIAATLGLSVFSFHLVEDPARGRRKDPEADQGRRGVMRNAMVASATLLVLALVLYTLRPVPAAPTFTADAPPATSSTSALPLAGAGSTLSAGITAALNATSFPHLRPGLDSLGAAGASRDIFDGCETATTLSAKCEFGVPLSQQKDGKVALVIGDSIAMSWTPAVTAALAPQGWSIVGFARGECPDATISVSASLTGGQRAADQCDRHHAALAKVVRLLKPTLVVMSSVEFTLGDLRGISESAATSPYERALTATQKTVAAPGRTVVTLTPPPAGLALLDCDSGAATPADCVSKIRPEWSTFIGAQQRAASASGTRFVDTQLWFCNQRGYCPSFVGSTAMKYDTDHMTKAYAQMLAAPLRRALLG